MKISIPKSNFPSWLRAFVFFVMISTVAYASPLSPDEAIKSFQIAEGFAIDLIASEPLVEDPVAIAWDERGRMFVAEMRDYPNNPNKLGRIKLLTDDDGDGRMDHAVIFAADLAEYEREYKPFLEPFDAVIASNSLKGDILRSRVIITVK